MAKEPYQTQILATIGHVCLQWALLETVAANIIWALLHMDHETGAVMTGGMDMQPRLNTAISLARHQKAPKPIIAGLTDIRKAVQSSLADRRNQAVHGVHKAAEKPDAVELTMLRWSGSKRSEAVSIADLHQLGLDIQVQVIAALLVFREIGVWHFGEDYTQEIFADVLKGDA